MKNKTNLSLSTKILLLEIYILKNPHQPTKQKKNKTNKQKKKKQKPKTPPKHQQEKKPPKAEAESAITCECLDDSAIYT